MNKVDAWFTQGRTAHPWSDSRTGTKEFVMRKNSNSSTAIRDYRTRGTVLRFEFLTGVRACPIVTLMQCRNGIITFLGPYNEMPTSTALWMSQTQYIVIVEFAGLPWEVVSQKAKVLVHHFHCLRVIRSLL